MPGTVRNLQEPFPPLLPAAGHSPSSPLERSCAALARCAEKYDQMGLWAVEKTRRNLQAAAYLKDLQQRLEARDRAKRPRHG